MKLSKAIITGVFALTFTALPALAGAFTYSHSMPIPAWCLMAR